MHPQEEEEEEEEEEEKEVNVVDPPPPAAAAPAVTRKQQAKMLVASIHVARATVAGKQVTAEQQEAIAGVANVKLRLEAANLQSSDLRAEVRQLEACPLPLSSTRSGCGIDRTLPTDFSHPFTSLVPCAKMRIPSTYPPHHSILGE